MDLHRRLFGLLDAARTNYLWRPNSTRGVVWALESWARERPEDPFLSFEERSFSIGAFNAAANRYAATYRRHHDLKRDDVVALILRKRPAYLWHVYGLFKLGAIPALKSTFALTLSAVRRSSQDAGLSERGSAERARRRRQRPLHHSFA